MSLTRGRCSLFQLLSLLNLAARVAVGDDLYFSTS